MLLVEVHKIFWLQNIFLKFSLKILPEKDRQIDYDDKNLSYVLVEEAQLTIEVADV